MKKKESKYTKKAFHALFRDSGIELTNLQTSQLYEYHKMIRLYNEEYDLVRTVNFVNLIQKHYIDCIYIARYMKFISPLLDIGSGAGFPGIPLKIVMPDMEIILAEKRAKRVEFLKMVINGLGLDKIMIYPHSISRNSSVSCNAVITRALESISKTLDRVSLILESGGYVFFMKGPNVGREMETGNALFKLFRKYDYTIPNSNLERSLIIFEKAV